jgi:hypothetical protein
MCFKAALRVYTKEAFLGSFSIFRESPESRFRAEEDSLYPALERLERNCWIQSEWAAFRLSAFRFSPLRGVEQPHPLVAGSIQAEADRAVTGQPFGRLARALVLTAERETSARGSGGGDELQTRRGEVLERDGGSSEEQLGVAVWLAGGVCRREGAELESRGPVIETGTDSTYGTRVRILSIAAVMSPAIAK